MELRVKPDNLLQLLMALNKAPNKLPNAADVQKYGSFRRAVRKGLRELIDNIEKANKKYEKELNELRSQASAFEQEKNGINLDSSLSDEDKQKKLAELAAKIVSVDALFKIQRNKQGEETSKLESEYREKKGLVSIRVNTEDLSFVKQLMQNNIDVFFGYQTPKNPVAQLPQGGYSKETEFETRINFDDYDKVLEALEGEDHPGKAEEDAK